MGRCREEQRERERKREGKRKRGRNRRTGRSLAYKLRKKCENKLHFSYILGKKEAKIYKITQNI